MAGKPRKKGTAKLKLVSSREEPPHARRFVEQRWLLDNIIRANGIDWDQPRTVYLNAPLGLEASADFVAIRQRVQKFADCSPAFQAAARRREARAIEARDAGNAVTARENFLMAAVHWGAAQWPFDENNEENLFCNRRKRECYQAYAAIAAHRVEEVWIPFKGWKLPAWLHLPPGYQGGKLPVVVTIPGMDSFKEISVAMYGDRWLSRGMAVLAVDGPGQYESAVLGIPVTVDNWMAAGTAIMNWLAKRPEIDIAQGRALRQQLRFVLLHGGGGQRAALQGGCGDVAKSRAGVPHDFRRSLADLQAALHVHGADQRRRSFRRIPPDVELEGARGKNPHAVSVRRRRIRRTVSDRKRRHHVPRHEGAAPARDLSGLPPRHRRRAVGDARDRICRRWLPTGWRRECAGAPMKNERWFVDNTGKVTKTPL